MTICDSNGTHTVSDLSFKRTQAAYLLKHPLCVEWWSVCALQARCGCFKCVWVWPPQARL